MFQPDLTSLLLIFDVVSVYLLIPSLIVCERSELAEFFTRCSPGTLFSKWCFRRWPHCTWEGGLRREGARRIWTCSCPDLLFPGCLCAHVEVGGEELGFWEGSDREQGLGLDGCSKSFFVAEPEAQRPQPGAGSSTWALKAHLNRSEPWLCPMRFVLFLSFLICRMGNHIAPTS